MTKDYEFTSKDRAAISKVVPEWTSMDMHSSKYGAKVKLTPKVPGAAAWSGVSVELDQYYPHKTGIVTAARPEGRPDYDRPEWRVRISWPSCGSQSVQNTAEFIELMAAAIAVAKIMEPLA